ncbi:hypothetical protein QC763_000460 [Podospora pseudopauciseta]|uniref:Uncharacterized protein n=2 Tax=Podospora TaxID=5144 RepID=A0ABR0HCC6_9PEZI|nr:hypothetical protein QC763_000460 [Podospora pseudopauciseta]KAK4676666.1 hypothetical protein QC764_000460 [Podospora pseudoanserina]
MPSFTSSSSRSSKKNNTPPPANLLPKAHSRPHPPPPSSRRAHSPRPPSASVTASGTSLVKQKPPKQVSRGLSGLTATITSRTDQVLTHVNEQVTQIREEQQNGTSQWVAGELDRTSHWVQGELTRTNDWVSQLREEQQKEASLWLEQELEKAPKVAMESAKNTYLGWLSGDEGIVTAALAWIPVAFVAGETVRVGIEVGKVVYDLVQGTSSNGQRRRIQGA